jgi:CHAP domain
MTFDRTKPSSTKPLETVKPKREDQAQIPGQKPAFAPMKTEQVKLSQARFNRMMQMPKRSSSDSTQSSEKPASTTNWNNRTFSATLTGTDGNRRVDFTLDRQDHKITGSFAIHGTGRGNIRGEYNPEDKTSPLRLECVFTEVTPEVKPEDTEAKKKALIGKTRVLDGWFLYAEGGAKKDENNDGKDDSSKAALPMLIGGMWKGGAKEYKLEPITPQKSVAGAEKIPNGSKAWDETTINPKTHGNMKALDEKEFITKLAEMAARLEIPRDFILAVMSFESWLDPAAENQWNHAYFGLIQFGQDAVEDMNRKFGIDWLAKLGLKPPAKARELQSLGALEQLPYVELYLMQHGIPQAVTVAKKAGRVVTIEELYMSILGGNASKGSDPNAVWKQDNPKSKNDAYDQNRGLDSNNDGQITVQEASDTVRLRWREAFGTNIDVRSTHLKRGKNADQIVFDEKYVDPLPLNYDASMVKLLGISASANSSGNARDITDAQKEIINDLKKNGVTPEEWAKIAAGIEMGSLDGIPVYFNNADTGNFGRNAAKDGYDYGLKWQCVEFIRRYYHDVLGVSFSAKGHARDYYLDAASHGLTAFENENLEKPKRNDLFVAHYGDTGHIGVISEVTDTTVTIAQQNFAMIPVQTYSLIKIIKDGKTYWKINHRMYGWCRKV